MKYILVFFTLLMFELKAKCQSEKDSAQSTIRLGGKSNPIIYLEDAILDSMEYLKLDLKKIKSLIIEGDSNWLKYHVSKGDTSNMEQYFDKEFKRGIIFLFNQDQLALTNAGKIKSYLRHREGLTLWKINSKPFTYDFERVEQISIRKIIRFEIYPSIKLKNLHSQKTHSVNIVVVDTE
ncbi:MAG: hypothetical protein ABIN36_10010 [Ferruginibacter sp.]